MKYLVRATSLYVYTAVMDSDEFPEVFTEEGAYDESKFNEVCTEVFPYGIVEDHADWEFTDLMEIGENEYERLKHKKEVEQEDYYRKQRRLTELQHKEYNREKDNA
jgi:hypothetical protein